jgi:hypothetical protein
VWLAAGALALAACSSCSSSSAKGGGSPQGDGGKMAVSDAASDTGSGPSAATACADFATAVCGQLNACTPFALSVGYGTMATCLQRMAIACAPTLSAPGSTATPSQMETCVQAIGGETCDDWLDNAQPSACSFMGSVTAGGPCGVDSQCQTGYCRLAAGTLCGTCTTRAMSGQSSPDGGPACVVDADCEATLVCNMGVCMAPAAQGATCTMTQPCERTLSCIGGQCATPKATGAACSAATDCNGLIGGYCNTQLMMCATTGVAMPTQACGVVSGGLATCIGGPTQCVNVNAMGQGTCSATAADGAPCGPGLGCVAPAACVPNGGQYKCTLPDPASCH